MSELSDCALLQFMDEFGVSKGLAPRRCAAG